MDILRKILFTLLLCLSFQLPAADTVNINTADKETLMNVKGIGEKRAEAIIVYREQHGPFKNIDDLASVQGIGQSIIDNNRDSLSTADNN